MSLIEFDFERPDNPLDAIEKLASSHKWIFERSDADEITISVGGNWCDYHVTLTWLDDLETLLLSCAFDIKVLADREAETSKLLALINEQLWMGHFDLWHQEGVLLFRQSLLLAGGADLTRGQVETMVSNAFDCCERYYQSFQFVVWAGKTAEEAVETALFETAGEA
ncbi:MAG: YbjN domain-containing protein [Rhodobacteraceae bacterium]|nr:YbjN domain-containing protein [Paracoccaceae bacterium]